MRTRRIAIRCRRTGRSAAVAVGTGTSAPVDLPVPEMPPGLVMPPGPGLDLPTLYGAPSAEHIVPQHPGVAVPGYLSDPPHAAADTAALDWDRNPGWPAAIGWSHIAQAAQGRSPRHARGGGWQMPGRAVAWTGVGMLAAAVLMLVANLLR